MWWQQYWSLILATPVVGTFLFARWLQRRPGIDIEAGTKCWDVFVKLTSALTVIVSGAFLFGKYIDQQEAQAARELSLREAEVLKQQLLFETDLHNRRRLLFDEAKGLAAKLAKQRQPDPASMERLTSSILRL